MTWREMQYEAWMEGWIVRYLGFDLQNSHTNTPRIGFLNTEFAGSSACTEFGSSLIIESMSPSHPCFDDVLGSQIANDRFWHERLETAIHVWDRRHKSEGDWPCKVLREKAAEILDELSLEESCMVCQEQFSEKLSELRPPFHILATAPKSEFIPDSQEYIRYIPSGNTFCVLVTAVCATVVSPDKHKNDEGESLGMLVARYTFPQTGDKWVTLAKFIYKVVLAGMDCITQQMDICVVTWNMQKKKKLEVPEELKAQKRKKHEEDKDVKEEKKQKQAAEEKDQEFRVLGNAVPTQPVALIPHKGKQIVLELCS